MTVKIEDTVLYTPDRVHAFDKDPVTELTAWSMSHARKDLSDDELKEFLRTARRRPHLMKELTPTRPRLGYRSRVTQVHEDGTLDLEVTNLQGNLLGYERVAEDQTGAKPHTWRDHDGA